MTPRSRDEGELDELDIEILSALSRNGRLGVRELARMLGRPASTISQRIRGLEKRGFIRGYTALIDHRRLGFDILALIMLNVEGGHIEDIERMLAKEPNVRAVYDITGEFDVAVIALFRRVEELDRFIKRILRNPYVKRSVTSIAFKAVKDEPNIDLGTALRSAEGYPPKDKG